MHAVVHAVVLQMCGHYAVVQLAFNETDWRCTSSKLRSCSTMSDQTRVKRTFTELLQFDCRQNVNDKEQWSIFRLREDTGKLGLGLV